MAMGMALAARRGDIPKSQLRGAAKEIEASDITTKELERFAKTKRKNLPMKSLKECIEESILSQMGMGSEYFIHQVTPLYLWELIINAFAEYFGDGCIRGCEFSRKYITNNEGKHPVMFVIRFNGNKISHKNPRNKSEVINNREKIGFYKILKDIIDKQYTPYISFVDTITQIKVNNDLFMFVMMGSVDTKLYFEMDETFYENNWNKLRKVTDEFDIKIKGPNQ